MKHLFWLIIGYGFLWLAPKAQAQETAKDFSVNFNTTNGAFNVKRTQLTSDEIVVTHPASGSKWTVTAPASSNATGFATCEKHSKKDVGMTIECFTGNSLVPNTLKGPNLGFQFRENFIKFTQVIVVANPKGIKFTQVLKQASFKPVDKDLNSLGNWELTPAPMLDGKPNVRPDAQASTKPSAWKELSNNKAAIFIDMPGPVAVSTNLQQPGTPGIATPNIDDELRIRFSFLWYLYAACPGNDKLVAVVDWGFSGRFILKGTNDLTLGTDFTSGQNQPSVFTHSFADLSAFEPSLSAAEKNGQADPVKNYVKQP